MSTPAPTLFKRIEPPDVADTAVRFYFAVDPASGHMYPTSDRTAILPRVDAGTGNLHLNDSAALAAARTIVQGQRARVY